jgi:hypothetical protein
LAYRKEGAPTMSLESPEAVIEQLDQMKRLAEYLEHQFMEADGSYRSAFHTFGSPEQFEAAVTTHLRKLVERHIERTDTQPNTEADPLTGSTTTVVAPEAPVTAIR